MYIAVLTAVYQVRMVVKRVVSVMFEDKYTVVCQQTITDDDSKQLIYIVHLIRRVGKDDIVAFAALGNVFENIATIHVQIVYLKFGAGFLDEIYMSGIHLYTCYRTCSTRDEFVTYTARTCKKEIGRAHV